LRFEETPVAMDGPRLQGGIDLGKCSKSKRSAPEFIGSPSLRVDVVWLGRFGQVLMAADRPPRLTCKIQFFLPMANELSAARYCRPWYACDRDNGAV
jgi:hypothetical protein